MADGLVIHIDGERAERLEIAAEMIGMSPVGLARALIDAGLPAKTIDPDPAIDHAIIEEAIRTKSMIPWPEVRDRLLKRHRNPAP
ncbi:antitoxin [Caulobacter segnis]